MKTKKMKRATPRKQAVPTRREPTENKPVGKKKRAKRNPAPGICPVWTTRAEYGPIHPCIDRELIDPFLNTVALTPSTGSFTYPLPGGRLRPVGGLHLRMRQKFFHGEHSRTQWRPYRGGIHRELSSPKIGIETENILKQGISTGKRPVADHATPAGSLALKIWDYWEARGHVPVIAQLPVIMRKANVATAGDFFTVYTNPETKATELWLWELKTGWPDYPDKTQYMAPPLQHIPLTPYNRWQLQLLFTRLAYERERGMKIDRARVIHAWRERPEGLLTHQAKIEVIEPESLYPKNWIETVNHDELYASL